MASNASKFEKQVVSLVLFGAWGDLARKKTWRVLMRLWALGNLQRFELQIFAYDTKAPPDASSLLRGILERVAPDATSLASFLSAVEFVPADHSLTDPVHGHVAYQSVAAAMASFERGLPPPHNRLFYLALPPSVYPACCAGLKAHCMAPGAGWTRVVVEKPFGRDLESSEALNDLVGAAFSEDQVYRIDHYLGKELVQNLVVMRFANRFLAPLWNRDNIATVQIVFKEEIGTDGRAGYFDHYGIIRDVVQNHLLQVMALIAMEKPCSIQPDDIRDEKLKVLRCVEPLSTDSTVLGQYTAGENGEPGRASHRAAASLCAQALAALYLNDPAVPRGSQTPTFAMCVLYIRNERWDGVPFILKAGKGLNESKMEIRVQLRDVPGDLYGAANARNEVVVRIQPDPAIFMKMTVKQPGSRSQVEQSDLELEYVRSYAESAATFNEAYERLLLDALLGDQQHFVRRDELRASWAIFTPLLKYVEAGGIRPEPYAFGSRGPLNADLLRERVGHERNALERDSVRGTQGRGVGRMRT